MADGGPDDEAVLDGVGWAFSRIRRRTTDVDVGPRADQRDHTRALLIAQIDEARGAEVTVGTVAERLGMDPSVASRMVSDAIAAGVVRRAVSQQDGRRAVIELTPAGEELRERMRVKYRATFEHITREWPRSERVTFARLLRRYVDDSDDARSRPPT